MNILQRQSRIFQKNPNGNSMGCIKRTYFRGGAHEVGGVIEGSDFFEMRKYIGKKVCEGRETGISIIHESTAGTKRQKHSDSSLTTGGT